MALQTGLNWINWLSELSISSKEIEFMQETVIEGTTNEDLSDPSYELLIRLKVTKTGLRKISS